MNNSIENSEPVLEQISLLPLSHDKIIKAVKNAIIYIPSMHLLICLGYIFFYNYSFGYGLSHFSGLSDIFSVSLSEIVPTYLLLIASAAVGAGTAFRATRRNTAARKPRTLKEADLLDKIVLAPILFMMLMWIGLFWAYAYAYDIYFWSLLFNALYTLILLLFYYISFFPGRPPSITGTSILAVVLVLNVASNAVGAAFIDRTTSYAQAKDKHSWCARYVIIRAMSDKFLAVAPDESRVIIDSDCKIRFIVLSGDRYRSLPSKPGFGMFSDAFAKLFSR